MTDKDKITSSHEADPKADDVISAAAEERAETVCGGKCDAATNLSGESAASEKSETEGSDADNSKAKGTVPDENSPRFLLRLVVTLTIICVLIASLLAAVNALTEERIADNTVREKTNSVLSIFSGGDRCELYRTEGDGSEVYLVFSGDDIIGYCTFVSSAGFGGNIDMMVGIDTEYKTVGVRIVSMSETPGVGSKTNTSDFLGQFVGGAHSAPTDGVDAVSGATISSNAVKAGVAKAHGIDIDIEAIASERGASIGRGEATAAPETTADTVSADTSAPSDAAEPAPVETEDEPFAEHGGGQNYMYRVDGTAVTAMYVLEVSREDETATVTEETEAPSVTPSAPKPTPSTTAPAATKPATTVPPSVSEPVRETEPLVTEPATEIPEETEGTAVTETVPWWLRPFGN